MVLAIIGVPCSIIVVAAVIYLLVFVSTSTYVWYRGASCCNLQSDGVETRLDVT